MHQINQFLLGSDWLQIVSSKVVRCRQRHVSMLPPEGGKPNVRAKRTHHTQIS